MIDYFLILITCYPGTSWSLNANDYDSLIWTSSTPKPTQSELDSKWQETQDIVAKQKCKKDASALLYDTDWTTIPDVADPANTPYLTNQAEFIAWRSQVRALAVNPVVDPVFPPKPVEVWG